MASVRKKLPSDVWAVERVKESTPCAHGRSLPGGSFPLISLSPHSADHNETRSCSGVAVIAWEVLIKLFCNLSRLGAGVCRWRGCRGSWSTFFLSVLLATLGRISRRAIPASFLTFSLKHPVTVRTVSVRQGRDILQLSSWEQKQSFASGRVSPPSPMILVYSTGCK